MEPDIRRLVADMVETLADARGVGLAAPQVHEPLRLILVSIPADRDDNEHEAVPLTAIANPVLEPLGDEVALGIEGCLSIPGMRGVVPRLQRVRWRGLDLRGREIGGEAEGFHARVLQHEVDHLDGVLYPMRMDDLALFGFDEELARRLATEIQDAGPQGTQGGAA